jgi:hypothetical protein
MREATQAAPGAVNDAEARLMNPALLGYGLLLLAMNLPFVLKYSPRAGLDPLLSAAAYVVMFAAVAVIPAWLLRRAGHDSRFASLLGYGLFLYGVAMLLLLRALEPGALQLDRWSALHNFWDAAFRGEYPYQAGSHMGNPISGFPALFLLALPFYWLGDAGYLQVAAVIGLAVVMMLKFREPRTVIFLMLLMLAMPAVQYQVFARSDLLANVILAACLLHFSLLPGSAAGRRLFVWGLVWGVALSTRGIMLIPLILAAFPLLQGRGVKAVAGFCAAVVAGFLGTFLPFFLWDPSLFLEHNPFRVQSTFLPLWGLILLLSSALIVGFLRGKATRPYHDTGVLLLVTVVFYAARLSFKGGWAGARQEGRFDVSFFVLPLPFLLLAQGERLGMFNARR